MANDIRGEYPYCAKIIDASAAVRVNLFKSLTDKNKFNKFMKYYEQDVDIYPKLLALSNADKISIKDLERIFEGYQAHHIIPVNLIEKSKILQEILEYVSKNNIDFKFNDMDNLIFLNKKNHLGSHGKYDEQFLEMIERIDVKDMDDAIDILIDKIDEVKALFAELAIGRNVKINVLELNIK